jgi:hypothetical protein
MGIYQRRSPRKIYWMAVILDPSKPKHRTLCPGAPSMMSGSSYFVTHPSNSGPRRLTRLSRKDVKRDSFCARDRIPTP